MMKTAIGYAWVVEKAQLLPVRIPPQAVNKYTILACIANLK